jgi:Flp pilus assembly protein TadG
MNRTALPTGRPLRRRLRLHLRRSGAATVELALVIPVFLVLFAGIVDFARIFRHDLLLDHAARAGALYASDPHVGDNAPWDDVLQAALAGAPSLKPTPQISVTYGFDSTAAKYVEVTAKADFTSLTGVPGFPKTTTISRKVRMRIRELSTEGI